ncbi:MAG: FprA family A-type flavoprotein [Bacteroidales bacterium]|jgi:flavorubredoxin
MKAVEVKDGVYWVGGIDWNLRSFHGYLTQRGSTYNAYLIIDEKITLIDTVKSYLTGEMLERIRSVVDPSKIDYVVCNHIEMDHSGGLPEIMKIAPKAALFCSPKGESGLREHYKENWNFKPMESGTILNLGKRNLHFILTPMVHWPDNMVVYMPEEKILFSNDAFGQHLASSERFDDEYPLDISLHEARKYYANIVLPYSKQVQKVLVGIKDIEIEVIANSHGIIWRKHINEIISGYKSWASNETRKKALIIYDTMWHSTEAMALAIQDAFDQKGYLTAFLSLQHNHISDIMTEVIDAEYICIGSPALNGRMLPTMSAFLTYLTGLAPKNRKCIVFGSYGWGPKQIEEMTRIMTESGFEVVATEKVKYVPSADDLDALRVRVQEVL